MGGLAATGWPLTLGRHRLTLGGIQTFHSLILATRLSNLHLSLCAHQTKVICRIVVQRRPRLAASGQRAEYADRPCSLSALPVTVAKG